MEWLTLKEAAEVARRSTGTIKRAIDKSNESNGLPADDQTSNRLLNRSEPANRGKTWYVEKKSLLSFYGLNDREKSIDQADDDLIDFLKSQLREKDLQLSREQERNRELQFMVAHAHKKIELLEAPREKEEKPEKGLWIKPSDILKKFGL